MAAPFIGQMWESRYVQLSLFIQFLNLIICCKDKHSAMLDRQIILVLVSLLMLEAPLLLSLLEGMKTIK